MTDTFGSFNFGASPYFVLSRSTLSAPPRRTDVLSLATYPGGVTVQRPPERRLEQITIGVRGTSLSNLEANVDTLKRAFSRPRQRLISSEQDGRWVIATCVSLSQSEERGPSFRIFDARFACESAYFQAAHPTADVRTPTFTLAPGETTIYRTTYSLTPAGTAPQNLRVIVANQSGSPTITRQTLRNLYYSPQLGISSGQSLPARSVLVFDDALAWDSRAQCVVTDLTNTTAWLPMADASGNLLDFAGQSKDFTPGASPTYQQDNGDGSADIGIYFASGAYADRADAVFGYTGDFTLHARLWFPTAGTAYGIMSKAGATAGYSLFKTAGDVLEFRVSNGTTIRTVTGATTLLASRYYDVAVTYTQATGTSRLYLNGALDGYDAVGSAYTPATTANNAVIGGAHNVSGGAFANWVGRLRDVAFHAAALTQAQVVACFRGGLWPHFNPTKVTPVGTLPDLNPRESTANALQLDLTAASALTTPVRVATIWRSAFE